MTLARGVKYINPLCKANACCRQKCHCTSSTELARLLGANEHNLDGARAALAPADLAELERVIAEQWERLPATG